MLVPRQMPEKVKTKKTLNLRIYSAFFFVRCNKKKRTARNIEEGLCIPADVTLHHDGDRNMNGTPRKIIK